MVRGRRREEGSGQGTRVYLWRIHVDIWQNQYNIVKLKNKIKLNKKKSDQSSENEKLTYRLVTMLTFKLKKKKTKRDIFV